MCHTHDLLLDVGAYCYLAHPFLCRSAFSTAKPRWNGPVQGLGEGHGSEHTHKESERLEREVAVTEFPRLPPTLRNQPACSQLATPAASFWSVGSRLNRNSEFYNESFTARWVLSVSAFQTP